MAAIHRTWCIVWLWSSILLQILLLGVEAQVALQLEKVPQYDAYCPGMQLLLICSHNTTFNDPEWRIMNGTQMIYRGITFRDSTLEAHSVIVNRDVLEVVRIDPLRHVFHGLRYLCLYDTSLGEIESNEVTVKLHEPPQVRELAVKTVDSTTANITWQQDDDACNQTTTSLLLNNNSDIVPADCKQTHTHHFQCLVTGLIPDTKYTLNVYITTADGRRSATAASVSFETEPGLGRPHPPTTPSSEGEEFCTREPLACGLYGVSGFFVLVILVTIAINVFVCVWYGRNRGEEDLATP